MTKDYMAQNVNGPERERETLCQTEGSTCVGTSPGFSHCCILTATRGRAVCVEKENKRKGASTDVLDCPLVLIAKRPEDYSCLFLSFSWLPRLLAHGCP